MKISKAFAKIILQIRYTVAVFAQPSKHIFINGALHVNTRDLSFTEHNFGDDVNLPLVEMLTGLKAVPWRFYFGKSRQDIYLLIGSILQDYCLPNAVVWGAGFINEPEKAIIHPRRICAVRGPLTREALLKQGIDCPEIYGDPAILLSRLYRPAVRKKYRLGIIPHVVDQKLGLYQRIRQDSGGSAVCVIDMENYGHWKNLLVRINECETIVSSSLHGVILADAYQIPNRWIEFSDRVVGAGFKFRDYYAGSGRQAPCPLKINEPVGWQSLLSEIALWKKPEYDWDGLLTACPLPLQADMREKLTHGEKY